MNGVGETFNVKLSQNKECQYIIWCQAIISSSRDNKSKLLVFRYVSLIASGLKTDLTERQCLKANTPVHIRDVKSTSSNL